MTNRSRRFEALSDEERLCLDADLKRANASWRGLSDKYGVPHSTLRAYSLRRGLRAKPSTRHLERVVERPDGSEEALQRAFVAALSSGAVLAAQGWPDSALLREEYRIGGGICDVVCFHTDGSITVFELKRGGLSAREYCTGLGQLLHASVQFGLSLASQGVVRVVRLVLVVPGGCNDHIRLACKSAGVQVLEFSCHE